jgi:hypothetical protein
MSTAFMMERITEAPPRFKAKFAGVGFLLSILTAAFAEIFVGGSLNVAGGLIAAFSMIAVTLLFYDILSPVNRSLSLLAASFNLVGLIFETLRLQPQGVNIAVVFDGFFCLLIGCLVFRSSFLPRILSVLMALGGLGWLTFLSPPLASYLAPYNLAAGILGEVLVMLWLLLMAVNLQPWNEPAAGASSVAAAAPSSDLLHI